MGKDLAGVIPRSVGKIFACVGALQKQGWEFVLECGILEVYQDEVFDLLVEERDRRPLSVKNTREHGHVTVSPTQYSASADF